MDEFPLQPGPDTHAPLRVTRMNAALTPALALALGLLLPPSGVAQQGQILSNSALVVPPPAPTETVTEDIRDIAPPVHIPNGWIWLWWVLALLALLAMARVLYKRWMSKLAEDSKLPPIPAHVRAKERLRKALSLIDDPRLFCGEVSVTLRVYLEERFEFHAPERTTEEFLIELKATDLLAHDQKLSLADFLQQCDLVKFARHEPPEDELRILHDSALRLIDETQFEPLQAPVATPPAKS